MVIKVYTSGISGNKEVKKRQQRIMMILESKCIKFEEIDITEPGKETDKQFMQEHAESKGLRNPLPPQIFNEDDYCGDYEGFDVANENDVLEAFLKLPVQTPRVNGNPPEKEKTPEKTSDKESNHMDTSIRHEELIDEIVPESLENNIDHEVNMMEGELMEDEGDIEDEEEEDEEEIQERDSSMKDETMESETKSDLEEDAVEEEE